MKPDLEQGVRDEAVIYKKEKNRPLSNYQKEINKCAQDIAIREPSLLAKRGMLLEADQKAVYNSGYNFKKGYSRSKRFLNNSANKAIKRPKLSKDFREKRIQDIEEEIKDSRQRISFKEKRVNAAANMKNYKVCDEITGEISEIKAKCRELEEELKQLLAKEKRSKKYQSIGNKNSSSSTSGDHAERVESYDLPSSPNSVFSESEPSLESSSQSEDIKKYGDIRKYMPSTRQRNRITEFTAEEIKKFERRLEEQYDLPDERYDEWLHIFHPDATRLVQGKAADKKTDASSVSEQDPQCSTTEDANLQLSRHMHPF